MDGSPAAHRLLGEIELGYIIISKLVGYTDGNSTWPFFWWPLNQGFSINILLNSQKALLHRTFNLIKAFVAMTAQVAPTSTSGNEDDYTPGPLDVEVANDMRRTQIELFL